MKWLSRLPEAVRVQPLASLFTASFKAFVIIFLPWVMLSGLNQYFAAADFAERLAVERNQMAQLLSVISSRAEPRQRFDAEFRYLAEIPFPSATFDRRLQQMLLANPGALEIHVYDAAGDCVTLPFLPIPSKFVARRFLECVQQPVLSTKYERFVIQFSGYRSAHKEMNQSPESIVKIGSSHDRQWGGWFKLHNAAGDFNGHLIVFIRKSALKISSMLDSSILQARAKHGRSYIFAWQDPASPDVFLPPNHGFASETATVISAVPYGESAFTCGARPGVKLFTEDGAIIVARTIYPVEHDQLYRGISFALLIASVIAFLLLTPLLVGVTRLYPGLKLRIAALFLFGAGMPLVLLIFTGVADRTEQEKILVDSWQKRNLEELTLIDEGLSHDYRVIEDVFRSQVEKIRKMPEKAFLDGLKQTGKLLSFSDVMHQILVIRPGAGFSFARETPDGRKTGSKESMVIYGEMLLEILNATYDETRRQAKADVASVINNMGGWLARSLILNSRKVGMLNLLANVMPTYVDFFVDSEYKARAMVFAFMSQSALQRNYLFKTSKARDQKRDSVLPRFAAVPVSMSPFWPAFPKRSAARNPQLRAITDQVIKGGIPSHATAEISGRKYLLSAMRGSNLDGYILVMARPYEIIADKIAMLRRNLQILAVLVVLLALFAARITSSLLLSPLGNLRSALEAVSSGNFRVQIPGATVSEFEAMLGSLNRTMSNFQELQVARTVQETLWPEEPLHGDDWHLFGKCITATELGGDHYDWMRLSDGRILLSIGDVTGHGIAPAMIQASIKVWLALNAEKCDSALALLQEISRLHFKYGARKLYMTCWLGYYTPATGQLEYASAGHPYPVMVSPDGSTESLKLPGMPLGVKENPVIRGDQRILAPGSSIILYTDGIVETADQQGRIIGFEGFSDLCRRIAGMPAAAAADLLFSAAASWGEQIDDQTVIVLHRCCSKGVSDENS